jgi:hypothetical protein
MLKRTRSWMSVAMGEALIAVNIDTDEIVGVARFATDPSRKDQVEIALAMVDEWQFQDVGSSLFDRLTCISA